MSPARANCWIRSTLRRKRRMCGTNFRQCARWRIATAGTPVVSRRLSFWRGVFQPIAVSEAAACASALAKRLKACRVYWNDAEATDAIDNDPIFDSVDGYWAREALREQLVALEIVEGL